MIRVVRMALVRWDDREEMNQDEADQDVADEVSEEVDSRSEVMRGEENDWQFLRRSELVGEQEWHQKKIEYYVKFFTWGLDPITWGLPQQLLIFAATPFSNVFHLGADKKYWNLRSYERLP